MNKISKLNLNNVQNRASYDNLTCLPPATDRSSYSRKNVSYGGCCGESNSKQVKTPQNNDVSWN